MDSNEHQLSTLNRILIVSGVLVIASIGLFFIVFQPKQNASSASRAQTRRSRSRNTTRPQAQSRIKSHYTSRLIKQIRSRLDGVEVTADPRAYIPSYLKQIEDLATRDGLTVTAVVPQPLPTPSGSPPPGPAPTGPARCKTHRSSASRWRVPARR